MPLTTYQAQQLLGSLLGSGSPATLYMGLYLTSPTNTGGGQEVSGAAYARVAITNNNTNWTGASATFPSVVNNGTIIAFPGASSAWGPVGWFGLSDAASGGNLLWWGALATSIDVPSGDVYEFPVGYFQLALG